MSDVFTALLFCLVITFLLYPEWAARWVFDYQTALFELQFQAAEEAME